MIATDATDIDALAAELERDGVVVERVMGSGEAEESHDRLAALVREVPFPVYVALVRHPGTAAGVGTDVDGSDALAALLHRRIGGSGLYVVATTDSILSVNAFGLGVDQTGLSLNASSNRSLVQERAEATRGASMLIPPVVVAESLVGQAQALVEASPRSGRASWGPTLSEDEVVELGDRAAALDARATWRPALPGWVEVRFARTGMSAFVGVVTATVVALLLGQTLRGWPRRGAPRQPPRGAVRRRRSVLASAKAPAPVDSAAVLTAQLDAARADLRRFVGRLDRTAGRPPQDPAGVEEALLARDLAQHLLEDAEKSSDLLTAVGAQMVVRVGERELTRGLDGRAVSVRPCFFDPRHPAAGSVTSWKLGQGTVEVPACRRCRDAVRAGREPSSLLRPTRIGQPRAYWRGDDVWARTGFGAVEEDLVRVVNAARRDRS